MKIYTRRGDDGTTGLLYGGRVAKDSSSPQAYGTVDEAQAALGLARAHSERGSELDAILLQLERDLWVLMAELATDPANRHKLVPGQSIVTDSMVAALEDLIDDLGSRFELPSEFVVPGEDLVAAHLDVARTVVRRAERDTIRALDGAASSAPDTEGSDAMADDPQAPDATPSRCIAYLNRLSDLIWTLARWQEGHARTVRSV